ncbi:MAG: EutP/PduV family microcompartment system protein [Lachnospiraceae bacterium]|nr:EutP/PduV family microcompartment system protein [Lachnospiraceae bacterium]
MKKIILVGRSEAGKTTLTQAMKGEKIHYHKTQYINHFDVIIDTPGEYAQNALLGRALAIYTYEADVVGMVLSATEQYSLYPPCSAAMTNRDTIGIVTKIHSPKGNVAQADRWLRIAGCRKIFHVDSTSGEGVAAILEYLREPGDVMPWEKEDPEAANKEQSKNHKNKTKVDKNNKNNTKEC